MKCFENWDRNLLYILYLDSRIIARSVLIIFIVDINDCARHQCKNGGVCKDGINSYTCSCPTYYSGSRCEKSKWNFLTSLQNTCNQGDIPFYKTTPTKAIWLDMTCQDNFYQNRSCMATIYDGPWIEYFKTSFQNIWNFRLFRQLARSMKLSKKAK